MIRKTIIGIATVAALGAAASTANAGVKVVFGVPYYGPAYNYCNYYYCGPTYGGFYGYYGYNKHWKHYNKGWKHNHKHGKYYKKHWKH